MPRYRRDDSVYSQLEQIPLENLLQTAKRSEDAVLLENRLGNMILFPDAIPETTANVTLEAAILRQIIGCSQTWFYNKNLKKIIIPEELLERIPNIKKLAMVFIESIQPSGIISFWLKHSQDGEKNLGSYIKPEVISQGFITVGVAGKQYKVKTGCIVDVPVTQSRVDITFSSTSAKLLGKQFYSAQVVAGQLGIIIDTR